MTAYILRRLLLMIPVLVIVAIIIFSLIHITPGDPASVMAGEEATPQQIEEMRERLGLNEPIHIQFIQWSLDAMRLDFGDSIFLREPVTKSMLDRVQPTALLTLYALTLAILIALPSGVISAVRRNSFVDRMLMVTAISGAAIPNFFFGILLILFFAVVLGWLPSGGYVDIQDDPVQHFRRMILPSVALGFAAAGLLARMVRSTMLDVLNEDYVRTAYAKGLPQRRVVLLHALRNAMIPAMTVFGISLAGLLGGAVVVETVFSLPGMGRLVVQSIQRRDFPVIQGVVLVTAVIQVLVMLLIDVLYVYVDPRVRYGSD
jgi:peptide/nickel transport system permease protein